MRARAIPFFRPLLAIGAILYAIVFAEVFLRLFAPQPLMPRYVTAAPWGVRMNVPGAVYHQHTPEANIEIRINAQGMRGDRTYPLAKPPGTCRIALFGDSYFVGYEVDLEDSFAGRLEADLKAAGYNAEVLNFAVSGFGQAEELRAMKGQGLAFHPDVALIEWHRSDMADNVRAGTYRLTPSGLEDTGAQYTPATAITDFLQGQPVYRWLIENSHLYAAVRERIALFVKAVLVTFQAHRSNIEVRAPSLYDQPHASALDIALLKATLSEASAANAKPLIVDIPEFPTRTTFVSNFDLLPQNWILNGPFVTPVDAFRAAARPDLKIFYERGQFHLSPVGNGILAKVVADRSSQRRRSHRLPRPLTAFKSPN